MVEASRLVTHINFDHTAFGVRDAQEWGRRLRRQLGATPIAGEILPDFRFVILHVGTATRGARLELLESCGEGGFLERFLERRGEGPHHLTFTVADLAETVARLRGLGLTLVGEEYRHEPWREAFVAPDRIHGVVIQLAQSNREYPSPDVLVATRERKPSDYPSSRGATCHSWWESICECGRLIWPHLASVSA